MVITIAPLPTSNGITEHAMTIPTDPEALLTRNDTAIALTAAGYPTAAATLATKASRGGGPRFRKFGPRPLYRWADALDWAQSKLGPAVSSTAELDRLASWNDR
jgi:hypothetical protein